jgi:hypothetical protein
MYGARDHRLVIHVERSIRDDERSNSTSNQWEAAQKLLHPGVVVTHSISSRRLDSRPRSIFDRPSSIPIQFSACR